MLAPLPLAAALLVVVAVSVVVVVVVTCSDPKMELASVIPSCCSKVLATSSSRETPCHAELAPKAAALVSTESCSCACAADVYDRE